MFVFLSAFVVSLTSISYLAIRIRVLFVSQRTTTDVSSICSTLVERTDGESENKILQIFQAKVFKLVIINMCKLPILRQISICGNCDKSSYEDLFICYVYLFSIASLVMVNYYKWKSALQNELFVKFLCIKNNLFSIMLNCYKLFLPDTKRVLAELVI